MEDPEKKEAQRGGGTHGEEMSSCVSLTQKDGGGGSRGKGGAVLRTKRTREDEPPTGGEGVKAKYIKRKKER